MKKLTIKEMRKHPEFNRIFLDLNAALKHLREALKIASVEPWNPELREFLRADVQEVREVLDQVVLALEAGGGEKHGDT